MGAALEVPPSDTHSAPLGVVPRRALRSRYKSMIGVDVGSSSTLHIIAHLFQFVKHLFRSARCCCCLSALVPLVGPVRGVSRCCCGARPRAVGRAGWVGAPGPGGPRRGVVVPSGGVASAPGLRPGLAGVARALAIAPPASPRPPCAVLVPPVLGLVLLPHRVPSGVPPCPGPAAVRPALARAGRKGTYPALQVAL